MFGTRVIAPPPPVELQAEDDSQVCQWRFDRLLRLGVDSTEAALLVRVPDVEHTIEALIAAGCPPDVAAHIVL